MHRDPVSERWGGGGRAIEEDIRHPYPHTEKELESESGEKEGVGERDHLDRKGPQSSPLTHCFLGLDLRMGRSKEKNVNHCWVLNRGDSNLKGKR